MRNARRGYLVAVVSGLMAFTLAGCFNSKNGTEAKTAEATTTFCQKAQQANTIDAALLSDEALTPDELKRNWTDFYDKIDAMSKAAPAEVRDEFMAFRGWVGDFNTTLARHNYRLDEALSDEQLTKMGSDERITDSRVKVATYIQATCGLFDPTASNEPTVTESSTTTI